MVEQLLQRLNEKKTWDTKPVFCFTSDIDWASENVMQWYFDIINPLQIKPTLFVTHGSKEITKAQLQKKVDIGIHPNFLKDSSHGNSFDEVIARCLLFTGKTKAFRTHRAFDVTDTNHLLKNKYGFQYCSNYITIMQEGIKPVLHESGLVNFPVFFEDGTHLYNGLDLDFKKYIKHFESPGIKVISFHPMHMVFNSPDFKYMRDIKDKYIRKDYQSISRSNILNLQFNRATGIRNTIIDIIKWVKSNNHTICSLNDLYNESIGE